LLTRPELRYLFYFYGSVWKLCPPAGMARRAPSFQRSLIDFGRHGMVYVYAHPPTSGIMVGLLGWDSMCSLILNKKKS
jgi:hypothetical protein